MAELKKITLANTETFAVCRSSKVFGRAVGLEFKQMEVFVTKSVQTLFVMVNVQITLTR